MSYDGPERRTTPCKEHEKLLVQFDHDINGNGKPGLKADVEMIRLALYGHEESGIKGMIKKQEDILTFIRPLKPFLNPKLLTFIFALSILACLKVLGTELIVDIFKHFFK